MIDFEGVFVPDSVIGEDTRPIGWLSPEGKLHVCDYHDHLRVASEICANAYSEYDGSNPNEYLLTHGWAHLTILTWCDHGWYIAFPRTLNGNSWNLSKEQHDYLKPYVEDNKNFLSEACVFNLKYEYPDIFNDLG